MKTIYYKHSFQTPGQFKRLPQILAQDGRRVDVQVDAQAVPVLVAHILKDVLQLGGGVADPVGNRLELHDGSGFPEDVDVAQFAHEQGQVEERLVAHVDGDVLVTAAVAEDLVQARHMLLGEAAELHVVDDQQCFHFSVKELGDNGWALHVDCNNGHGGEQNQPASVVDFDSIQLVLLSTRQL
jgi:hypothetical protein